MQIETRTYTRDCVTIREEQVPPTFMVVDTYHPCPSNIPWDYHGGNHTREIRRVLLEAGIKSITLVESHTNSVPVGSGPGGRVRFGDGMMPGIYRVAVSKHKVVRAREAIVAHEMEVEKWIQGERLELPLACRS